MDRPLRVIIVDDEPLARDCIRIALADEPDVEVVADCADGAEAVAAIRGRAPDLVFLDVQMPGAGGFDVVEEIGVDAMPAVVFVTAYEEHALRAFRVHALDYVLKPFDDARFRDAFRHARRRLAAERRDELGDRLHALLDELRPTSSEDAAREPAAPSYASWLTVTARGATRLVRVDDVDRFEADGNYVRIHAGERSYLMRISLRSILARLDPTKFRRVHRSTILNLARIREVQPWMGGDHVAILDDGERVRVSRTYRDALLQPIL